MNKTMPSLQNPSPDKIINDLMSTRAKAIEGQIQLKNEALGVFHKLLDANPEDQFLKQQHDMIMVDLKTLTDELISIRKDSDFIKPERYSKTPTLEQYVDNLKERYLCKKCKIETKGFV